MHRFHPNLQPLNKRLNMDHILDLAMVKLAKKRERVGKGRNISATYFSKKYLTIIKRRAYGIVMYKWEALTKTSPS